jgi:regulation of enolase protein 1 (concanavalin A-like superfamily)
MNRFTSLAVRSVSSRLIAVCFVLSAVMLPQEAAAQALPSGWSSADVGSPAVAGTATYSGSTFTVEGAGVDVWDPSDQFRFVYRQVSGNVTIVARVASLENVHAWTKGGVMIRESLSATSRHAFVLASPGKGIAFQRRATTGGTSASTAVTGAAPVWLRLVRSGSTFTASRSTNGTSWTQIGTATISMGSSIYVGLAVTSHNASQRATATFTNVSVDQGGGTLPSGWTGANIGSPAVAGSASHASGTFTIRGAGVDIWGTSDQFMFAYRQVTGDVDVVARVATLSGPDNWSKAGVMVRSSLNANSAHASMFTSVAKGHAFQRRPGTGMSSLHTAGGTGTAPVWVKLERRGSAVTAFRSSNGTSWTMIGSETLTLPTTFYVGLAVTSHNVSSSATATFTNVTVSSPSSTNTPPTVSLTGPAAGATYAAPATIAMTATASDTDGTVSRVEFYAGATLVGTDATSPYAATWNNVPAGSYSLTAVAYDNAGAVTTSSARTVTVNNPAPPSRAVFNPSSDHATVTRYVLDIFTSGANPNSATPIASQNLGKPSVVNGECNVNIATTINGLPSGTYFATVVAVSPGGTSSRARSSDFNR